MLAAGREAAYISEPLNVWHRPGILRTPVGYWYTYICSENEGEYLPALLEMLDFRYHTWAEVRSLRSRKDFMRMGRDWSTFRSGKLYHKRPLVKDPFAIFSARWFVERLNFQVVITVRHPAAFTSSLKRLKWPFEFNDLLAQDLLMRDRLEPFREEMEEISPDDIIGQGSLLWKIIYQTVADSYLERPGFQLVRHEDLSIEPVVGFRKLYKSLGLSFTKQTEETILGSSAATNPKELSKKATHSIMLDSQTNLYRWKHRLTSAEIDRIRALTGEVAARYYPEASWE
jgi:hypothetical protein